MQYKYYKFGNKIARLGKDKTITSSKEFYKNGEWINDEVSDRHLTDAMMDYGDWSPSDYDDITEEEAMNLIKNK